jgi:hypothetical protein
MISLLILLGVFYLILNDYMDREVVKDITFMLIGGVVGLLFGTHSQKLK